MSVRSVSFQSFCFLIVLFFCMVSLSSAAETPGPTEQLKPFVDRVVAILTDSQFQGEAKQGERRKKVMGVVHDHFDFYEMSKRVYGQQWTGLPKPQQNDFVDLFTRLLEHAYIGKIETYSNQTVEFEKERQKGNLAEVQTVLVDNAVRMPISYLMIQKNDKWMIFDVAVEKVSIARNYRDQFRQVLKDEGHDGLIDQLKEKLRLLESK